VAWLLARAKGQPGPSISPARAARYEKLEAMLAELPVTPGASTPSEGWQDRVLAAIDAEDAARDATGSNLVRFVRRRRTWLVGIVGVAAAAAAAFWLLRPDGPQIRAVVERSAANLGAMGPAMVGDTLVVSATVDEPAELRVYDEAHKEAARCATTTGDCASRPSGSHTEIELRVRLASRGVYTVLVFSPPLGGAPEGLDVDVVNATKAPRSMKRFATDPVQ
jgi:hypothetical protein